MDLQKLNEVIGESSETGGFDMADYMKKTTIDEIKSQVDERKNEIYKNALIGASLPLVEKGGLPLAKGLLSRVGATAEEQEQLLSGDIGSVITGRISQGVQSIKDAITTKIEDLTTNFENPLFNPESQGGILNNLNINEGIQGVEMPNVLDTIESPSMEEALTQIRATTQPIMPENIPQGAGEVIGQSEEAQQLKNVVSSVKNNVVESGGEAAEGAEVGAEAAEGAEVGLETAAEASVVDDWNPVGLGITLALGLGGLAAGLFTNIHHHKANLQPKFIQQTQPSQTFGIQD